MSKTILIVDDEPEFREMVAGYLEEAGYTIFEAGNGEDAVTILNSKRVHLAVVDVMMPRMDGLRLLREIKTVRKDFPVILMTGFAVTKYEVEHIRTKPDAFITKPFSMIMLSNLIRQFVGV